MLPCAGYLWDLETMKSCGVAYNEIVLLTSAVAVRPSVSEGMAMTSVPWANFWSDPNPDCAEECRRRIGLRRWRFVSCSYKEI